MLRRRTLLILLLILAGYGLSVLPGFIWPAYFDSVAGLLVIVPSLSVYLFHKIGVPGLLEHNGLCGWGWCAPTVFGWVFVVAFWIVLARVLAWVIAALVARYNGKPT
jgi:hypothetical protein